MFVVYKIIFYYIIAYKASQIITTEPHVCRGFRRDGYSRVIVQKNTFHTYSCSATIVSRNDSWDNIGSTDGSHKGNFWNIRGDVLIHILNRTGKILLKYKILNARDNLCTVEDTEVKF